MPVDDYLSRILLRVMKTPIPPLAAPLGAGLLVLTLLGSLPLSGCRSTATTAANPSTVPAAPKVASMTQLSNDLRATRNALDRTPDLLRHHRQRGLAGCS